MQQLIFIAIYPYLVLLNPGFHAMGFKGGCLACYKHVSHRCISYYYLPYYFFVDKLTTRLLN